MNYDLNDLNDINNLWSFFITDEIKVTRDFFFIMFLRLYYIVLKIKINDLIV